MFLAKGIISYCPYFSIIYVLSSGEKYDMQDTLAGKDMKIGILAAIHHLDM